MFFVNFDETKHLDMILDVWGVLVLIGWEWTVSILMVWLSKISTNHKTPNLVMMSMP